MHWQHLRESDSESIHDDLRLRMVVPSSPHSTGTYNP
jgi:hypothetical protein